MKIIIFELLIFLLISSYCFGFESTDRNSQQNEIEYKALEKCAKLKVQTFNFQTRQIYNYKFLDRQLEELHNKRLEISKAVKRLEMLSRIQEKKNKPTNTEEFLLKERKLRPE